MSSNEKIDIVIMWVDGNDEKWQEKKNYWMKKYGFKQQTVERYRDWDNLKYLFRGIEKYASWYNHIYLITDNQKPNWLNTEHKNVTVVDHRDFIGREKLPLFNSRAIELNLHRIPGLNENFIYFNDDMFIINPIKHNAFFYQGQPVDSGIMDINYPKTHNQIQKVILNNLGIINENFNARKTILNKPTNWFNFKYGKYNINNLLLSRWTVYPNFINHHLPIPFKKKTFETVWEKYEDRLKQTVESKFRNSDNYNVWLMRYWQLASNDFFPRSNQLGIAIQVKDNEDAKKCKRIINESKYQLICINDNEETKEFSKTKQTVIEAFELKFKKKSSFEL